MAVRGMIKVILNARFAYLFCTSALLLLLRPFIAGATALTITTEIFLWFIVISCVWAVHEKHEGQWFVVTMAAAVILADLLDFMLQTAVTSWISSIAITLFLGYAVVVILFYLTRQKEVTADMIMAGASEYMLIAILWACLYSLIETAYPGSFNVSGTKMGRSEFIYFSFVTLTTTGYGDILPLSVQSRSLAILETITGQLFIAITVARLVSLFTVQGSRP